jgi:nucleoside-diphosphate-sugar epimerase
MKVFVTGASGFIGSALTKELLAHGHTVVGLARSDASAAAITALGAEVHRGDLEDLDSVRAGAKAADGVAHLAFDHAIMATDYAVAAQKDNAAIAAIGEVLAGTNKPFVVSSGTLLVGPTKGAPATEDDAALLEGHTAVRGRSEVITLDLAKQGVRSAVIRLPPTVHGANVQAFSFIRMITGAAAKNGYAGYVGDGTTRWPAANVLDVAVLYRLVLENGAPGLRYHAAADEGNVMREIAEAVGAHLRIPVKPVAPDAGAAYWGFPFLDAILGQDNFTSSALTRERTGWKPTCPSMIDELKAGKYFS